MHFFLLFIASLSRYASRTYRSTHTDFTSPEEQASKQSLSCWIYRLFAIKLRASLQDFTNRVMLHQPTFKSGIAFVIKKNPYILSVDPAKFCLTGGSAFGAI
jgi:hypothetical protein